MLDVTNLQLFGVLLVHHELDLCFKLVLVAKALIFQPHNFVFIMVDEDFKLADFIRKLLDFRLLLCYEILKCTDPFDVLFHCLVLSLVAVLKKRAEFI